MICGRPGHEEGETWRVRWFVGRGKRGRVGGEWEGGETETETGRDLRGGVVGGGPGGRGGSSESGGGGGGGDPDRGLVVVGASILMLINLILYMRNASANCSNIAQKQQEIGRAVGYTYGLGIVMSAERESLVLSRYLR